MTTDNLPPLPEPGQISGAPMASYSPEDQAFFRFWYGHMLGDLMQPPLVDVRRATARYIWDAAMLAERERCAKVCEEVATHGRYQMEIDPINTAFWNGYSAGADQCATDILESDK